MAELNRERKCKTQGNVIFHLDVGRKEYFQENDRRMLKTVKRAVVLLHRPKSLSQMKKHGQKSHLNSVRIISNLVLSHATVQN